MEVVLAQPRGFCAGVVRAIKIVELALEKYGPPVYVKHPIVHNQHVVDRLAKMGAVTVDSVDQVPAGSTVVFSAHGSPPQDFDLAKERNLNVIDGTCPLVTKVHNEVKKYAKEGRSIIVVGHENHVEAVGTTQHALSTRARVALIEPEQKIDPGLSKTLRNRPVAVVTQTTLSQEDVALAVRRIKRAFPGAVVRNDVCYATTNRQQAVKKLAEEVDLILVVGSATSSNCNRLVEVAKLQGISAFLIETPDDLDRPQGWDEGLRIGVTSGASTPEELVEAVIARLKPSQVRHLDGPAEDITFVLPKELREV